MFGKFYFITKMLAFWRFDKNLRIIKITWQRFSVVKIIHKRQIIKMSKNVENFSLKAGVESQMSVGDIFWSVCDAAFVSRNSWTLAATKLRKRDSESMNITLTWCLQRISHKNTPSPRNFSKKKDSRKTSLHFRQSVTWTSNLRHFYSLWSTIVRET